MTKRLTFFSLFLALLAGSVIPAIAGEAAPWPPGDPGQDAAKTQITTAWAGRLRDVHSFADLQKAAGAGGRLEAVEDTGDAPRAVYRWTGAGGKGAMRAYLYRSGDFGFAVTPADGKGEIIVNNFGAFVCPSCTPPINSCGRRPSWVSHEVHWDTFDCGCTLTGPQSLTGSRC